MNAKPIKNFWKHTEIVEDPSDCRESKKFSILKISMAVASNVVQLSKRICIKTMQWRYAPKTIFSFFCFFSPFLSIPFFSLVFSFLFSSFSYLLKFSLLHKIHSLNVQT